jgi:serine/threonine protein kinase
MVNSITEETSDVVVKAFQVDTPPAERARSMALLRTEMHAADTVNSPHVIRYITVGNFRYPDLPGCPQFIALIMKQEKEKLEEYVRRLEELDEVQYAERTRALYKQLIKAYQAIHAAGIVHLDVKPDNTLLTNEEIKICDFGLSKFHRSINYGHEVLFDRHFLPPHGFV